MGKHRWVFEGVIPLNPKCFVPVPLEIFELPSPLVNKLTFVQSCSVGLSEFMLFWAVIIIILRIQILNLCHNLRIQVLQKYILRIKSCKSFKNILRIQVDSYACPFSWYSVSNYGASLLILQFLGRNKIDCWALWWNHRLMILFVIHNVVICYRAGAAHSKLPTFENDI